MDILISMMEHMLIDLFRSLKMIVGLQTQYQHLVKQEMNTLHIQIQWLLFLDVDKSTIM